MLHRYLPRGNRQDGERRPRVPVERAPHATRIDEVNAIDDGMERYVGMPQDMGLAWRLPRQGPETAFRVAEGRGVFLFLIEVAVDDADAEIPHRDNGFLRQGLQVLPIIRKKLFACPVIHFALLFLLRFTQWFPLQNRQHPFIGISRDADGCRSPAKPLDRLVRKRAVHGQVARVDDPVESVRVDMVFDRLQRRVIGMNIA